MFVQAIRKLPVYTGRCWITRVDPPLQRCLASLSLVFVQLMKLDLRTFVFLDVIVVKVIMLCEGLELRFESHISNLLKYLNSNLCTNKVKGL